MCFGGGGQQKVEAPAAPAETLAQAAPVKKTVSQDNVGKSKGSSQADQLSIGTKRYRNTSSLPGLGIRTVNAPSGIPVNM